MEDLIFAYDGTVRNGKGKIVQFRYGDDNVDTTKVESQKFPITEMTLEDIYNHFQIPSESVDAVETINYTKTANSRIKKQNTKLIEYTKNIIDYFVDIREKVAEHVFKYSDGTTIHIPVYFNRIINNISKELKYKSNSLKEMNISMNQNLSI